MRVFVTGTVLAGCTETVRSLGRLAKPRFELSRAGAPEWKVAISGHSVCLRARVRTSPWYDALIDADKDPRYRAEARFIARTDAIIFVADSQVERLEANLGHLDALRHLLRRLGRDPDAIPVVFALNKRDLPNAMALEALRASLRWPQAAYVPTIATRGVGAAALIPALVAIGRPTRLRAIVTQVTGKTVHSVMGVVLPPPAWIEIEPGDHGWYLLHYNAAGECVTDTWHPSVDEARRQAKFEFLLTDADWFEPSD